MFCKNAQKIQLRKADPAQVLASKKWSSMFTGAGKNKNDDIGESECLLTVYILNPVSGSLVFPWILDGITPKVLDGF